VNDLSFLLALKLGKAKRFRGGERGVKPREGIKSSFLFLERNPNESTSQPFF
jgi:hypothetical protein